MGATRTAKGPVQADIMLLVSMLFLPSKQKQYVRIMHNQGSAILTKLIVGDVCRRNGDLYSFT